MSDVSRMTTVLVLRTCNADLTSHNGFQWKAKGVVTCPDWDPKPECGNGLHGLLWGEGDGTLLDWDDDAKWLVVKVPADSIVHIGGKVKFPRGTVVFCGARDDAIAYLVAHGGENKAIVGGTATAGDRGTATAGDRGTATAGYGGTATAGYWGTATAGYGGTLIIRRYAEKAGRYRLELAYVGENGIKPGVAYKLDTRGRFTEVTEVSP